MNPSVRRYLSQIGARGGAAGRGTQGRRAISASAARSRWNRVRLIRQVTADPIAADILEAIIRAHDNLRLRFPAGETVTATLTQVEQARAWLRDRSNVGTLPPRLGSYRLKHIIERSDPGRSYVSEGALIIACLCEGIRLRPSPLSADSSAFIFRSPSRFAP